MQRSVIVFLLIVAAIASVSATGSSEAGAENEQAQPVDRAPVVLRIGTLRGPTAVGMAPLMAQPDRLGPEIDPQFTVYGTPDLLVSQILAGVLDIVALPTNLAANLYNRQSGLQLLAASGGGVLYLVSDRALGWEDIRGRTVHTLARGATPDILFQALARASGLEPGIDFDLRYSADQTELAQQLIAGHVDLAVLPEPFVTRVIGANPDLRVAMDLGETYREHFGGETYPMTALAVSRSFAEQHATVLETFAAAYIDGLDWFRANREQGAAEAAERVSIPAPVIVSAFDRLNLLYIPAATARDDVHRLLEIFHDFNPRSIGGSLPDDGFYRR
ncbi:MAG: ABC transporter substrate-binding protein [Spirochaetaceae bacterium]|nr:MAG: ABC transporter substrate-binding protein [Spirochaetaceae bacterium]